MVKLIKICCVLAILSFAIYACATKKKASGAEIIKVEKGHIFEIKLKSNPTTGYSWMLSQPLDSAVIEFDKKDFISDGDPNNPMIGAGGSEIWVFTGVNKGKAPIKMKYARKWEDKDDVKTKEFLVKVK